MSFTAIAEDLGNTAKFALTSMDARDLRGPVAEVVAHQENKTSAPALQIGRHNVQSLDA